MAIMEKGVHVSATVGNVCFYQMGGRTYQRKKSSLTRKRVLKSKSFEKTRKCAADLGRAARIGSVIYKALPGDIRDRWIYRAITGEAASLLYEGKEEQEVKDLLWKKYIETTKSENEETIIINGNNMVHSTKESNIQLRKIFFERWEKQGKSDYYFKQAWQKRGYFNRERFFETLEFMDAPWNKT
jgi:hypothetical protein